MKLSARLVLILAVLAGVLEYLNATTFGLTGVWHSVVTYGLFVISSLGVTAAVGNQLGVDIEEILHLTPAGVAALTTLAVVAGGAVQTFAIGGVAKGVILGVIAFITTIFGPGTGSPTGPHFSPEAAPSFVATDGSEGS